MFLWRFPSILDKILRKGVEILRKTILYIAVSLDGMIAAPNDDLSYLNGYDDYELVKSSYQDLLNQIDTIMMGRKTYDYILKFDPWPYQGFDTYVVTSHVMPSLHATLTSETPSSLIKNLLKKEGKDIWVVGGSMLAQSLIKDDLIDEMVIATIPTLLGEGIRLFGDTKMNLDCTKVQYEKGLILATYQRKKV